LGANRPAGSIVTRPGVNNLLTLSGAATTPTTPANLPRCTLTANVRLGAVALCTSCNAARSTLWRNQAPVPLPTTAAFDVLGWVATAHQQANAAERTLPAALTRARQIGVSWSVIGAQLGV
jgi:hypothetical protein